MPLNIALRYATPDDHPFVERVFFTTQRWIIERLFGWRGDQFEHRRFRENHDVRTAQIAVVEGENAGWIDVTQRDDGIEIRGIYLLPAFQNRGVGTKILKDVIARGNAEGVPVRLSVAKINPARRLYERLGFAITDESEFKFYMELSVDTPRPHETGHLNRCAEDLGTSDA
jgi:ribosomal protein S18 acetylase RimI-like enzyme